MGVPTNGSIGISVCIGGADSNGFYSFGYIASSDYYPLDPETGEPSTTPVHYYNDLRVYAGKMNGVILAIGR